jgi:hypothetical protein
MPPDNLESRRLVVDADDWRLFNDWLRFHGLTPAEGFRRMLDAVQACEVDVVPA